MSGSGLDLKPNSAYTVSIYELPITESLHIGQRTAYILKYYPNASPVKNQKMRKDVENFINTVYDTVEEWEEAPAKEKIEQAFIELTRKLFTDGCLYGYDNGLNKNHININSEMDKRGLLITIKPANGTDTAT
jgi:hypothetical protein